MGADIILSLRQELLVTIIIFLLLFVKVGAAEYRTEVVLNWVNVLLFANLVLGFFPIPDATLFSGMFHTNRLIALEKNMLNLGTLIISLQAYDWLKGSPAGAGILYVTAGYADWIFLYGLCR